MSSHHHSLSAFLVHLTILAALAAAAEPQELDRAGVEYFEREIRPVLVQHCYECHSTGATNVKGGLVLDTREAMRRGGDSGPAVVPGDIDESLLIGAIRHEDFEMPPDRKLPDEVIQRFVRWITMGAPDPRTGPRGAAEPTVDVEKGSSFWAFQVPAEVEVPPVQRASWPRTDVDRFVLASLESRGLTPVGDASRRDLIRRATFDLIGLPPTPDEVTAFVDDTSADAFSRVVDRLLDSPHFGERWGRHWLDVSRYAESTGRTRNFPFPFAWRYRDYVIASLNGDKPYDRFITEQIAGDLLPHRTGEDHDRCLVATGYLALGSYDLNERDAQKFRMDVVDEQINLVGRGILALTAGCARCHDHKFDPIPTRDYYALAGIFRSTAIRTGLTRPRGGGNQGYFQESSLISLGKDKSLKGADRPAERPRFAKESQRIEKRIAQLHRRVQQLQSTSRRQNGGKGRAAPPGRPASRDGAKRPRPADQNGAKIAQVQRQIKRLETQWHQFQSTESRSTNLAMGVCDLERAEDCRIHIHGDARRLGDAVPRGFLSVLDTDSPLPADISGSGRLQLAHWLTEPGTPAGTLTARVMVNRIWHHLFGRGLVPTVDNFGAMGDRPSHPQLLDYLAMRFVDQGWSMKKLIRDMMLSRTYQLSCRRDDGNYEIDPDNRFFWRMNQRRLEAEAIRDAMLMVSGQLESRPPVGSPVLDYPVVEIRQGPQSLSDDGNRPCRTVYLPILRGFVPGMLQDFDFAEPSEVTGRRDITTVATQALYMMNNPFVWQQAQHAADRLLQARERNDRQRIDLAYLQSLGRTPNPSEAERALRYVTEFGQDQAGSPRQNQRAAWTSLYQALFASAEFRYLN